jgi:uncharacterized protein (TIRG00374 family)
MVRRTTQVKSSRDSGWRIPTKRLIQLLILGALVYIVIAGMGGLRQSLQAVKTAGPAELIAAAGCIVLSYGAAALTYKMLVPNTIPFMPTLLVQISTGLTNRLLPGGLGGMGINALYLKKRGLSLPAATAIVATNNTLGLIGNMLLLGVIALIFPAGLSLIQFPGIPMPLLITVAAGLVVVVLVVISQKKARVRSRQFIAEAARYLRLAAHRPRANLLALVSSCSLTALHATALYLVLAALNVHIAWGMALLAISAGAFVGAAIPTPGGIGGAEAGIAAALVAVSVLPPLAAAAALIFRALTFWLPLIPGYMALRVVEKRYLY